MQVIVSKKISLQNFLKEHFPKSSTTTLRSWIQSGRILIDGHYALDLNMALEEGQNLTLRSKSTFLREGIKVLYEDSVVIIAEKPAGMLSVATDFETQNTLQNILKVELRRKDVFAVHRLDRETSGVMIFACSENVKKKLKDQFAERSIQKVYYAIVEGKLTHSQGTWKSFLEEDAKYFVRSSCAESGKLAITEFNQIWTNKKFSLLRLHLLTGKKNQLRVHCSESGHPISGDKKYQAKTNPLKRMALHSYSLSFFHPEKKKNMLFIAPLPRTFYKVIGSKKVKL